MEKKTIFFYLKKMLIIIIKRLPIDLVDELCDPNDGTITVEDWHTKHTLRCKSMVICELYRLKKTREGLFDS